MMQGNLLMFSLFSLYLHLQVSDVSGSESLHWQEILSTQTEKII